MHYPFALDEIKVHAGESDTHSYSALNNRENELFNRHFKLPVKLFSPAKMESILLRFQYCPLPYPLRIYSMPHVVKYRQHPCPSRQKNNCSNEENEGNAKWLTFSPRAK